MKILPLLITSVAFVSTAFASNVSTEIQKEIGKELQTSFSEFAKAESLPDWESNQFHPEALLSRILAKAPLEVRGIVCKSLGKLSAEKIGVFYEALSQERARKLLKCAPALRERFERYLEERTRVLETVAPAELMAKRLASLEVAIDIEQTGRISDAGLKPGQVAITVDDGPSEKYTQPILNTFTDYGVRATYFQVGVFAKKFPALSQAVVDAKHTLGTHSWSHAYLWKLPFAAGLAEIEKGIAAVSAAAGGIDIHFFRYPGGGQTAKLDQELVRLRQREFHWNMDSGDWRVTDPVRVYQETIKSLNSTGNRGMIVFHDTHPWTAAAMPKVLQEMARRNITPVVFVPH